jgi:PAS domain S-box-containing protein
MKVTFIKKTMPRVSKESTKKTVQCWKVFQCNKKKCPAYKSKDLRCWLFSGTHCRDTIQGTFIEKIEICLGCPVFKANIDNASMKATCRVINKQFREFRQLVQDRDRELRDISMELALGITEVFEALKKIASGDPTVRLKETSGIDLIKKLKHMVNLTAKEIGEIVDQSHEIAIGIAEHFDVLHRVTKGDLDARVESKSKIALMDSLKKEINKTIMSISKEITDRKAAAEALQRSEAEKAIILDSLTELVVYQDTKHRIIWANRAAYESVTTQPGTLTGKYCYRVWHGRFKTCKDCPVAKALKTGKTEQAEIAGPDGRYWHIWGYPIRNIKGRITGAVETALNITEGKKAKEALQEREALLHLQFERMPIACITWDLDFRVVSWNPAAEKIFGFPEKDVLGKHPYDFIVPKELQPQIDIIWKRLLEGDRTAHSENENITKDGRIITCYWVNTPLKKANGNVMGAISMAQDITDSKKASEELMANLSLLDSTIESTADGILVVDSKGKIVKCNQKFMQMWRIPDEIIETRDDGKALAFVLDQLKDPDGFLSKVKELYANPDAVSYDVLKFKDGRYFERYSQPREIEGKIAGRVWSFRDVTARKKAEEALRKNRHELTLRVQELEEFYDMAVGRELRMIELKKEIERLNLELEKHRNEFKSTR